MSAFKKLLVSVGTQTEDSCLRELTATHYSPKNNINIGASDAFSANKPPRKVTKGLTVTFSPLQPTLAGPRDSNARSGACSDTNISSPPAKSKPPPEEAESKSPSSDSESNNKDGKDKENQQAIFSPKSAANALTSLFTSSTIKANPRQCFPPTNTASSPSGATTTSDTSEEEEMSPPNSSTKSESSVAESDSSPTHQTDTPSTAGGSSPHQWHQDGMSMKHVSAHPYHHSQQASPTVYFSYSPYYPDAPHHWSRHPQYQGPWTPIVAGKIPGGTPHHMRGPPPQSFAWDPSRMPPMMEAPQVMYHHAYGPPPPPPALPPPQHQPLKDGSDPNSAVRLASNNTSFVTPTPKKIKLQGNQQPVAHVVHLQPPQVVMQRGPHGHPVPVYATVAMPHPPQTIVPHPPAATESQDSPEQQQPPQAQQPPPPPPASSTASGLPPMAPTSSSSQASAYSRKKKSLGILAENFMQKYQNHSPGTDITVDECAAELGVERRRIYDVVNILESIQLVVKKGKNTYSWMGKQNLPDIFGKLQAQAIAEFPDDAVKHGLKEPEEEEDDGSSLATNGTGGGRSSRRGSMSSTASDDSKASFRSLAKLSQQFLQVFLVGYDNCSLPQASEMIQGSLSAEAYAAIGTAHAHIASRFDPTAAPPPSLDNPAEFRRAAQRGLKTKIRRLYDIANVFLSVGILKKVEGVNGGTIDVLSGNRRPNFAWAFSMSIKDIQKMYEKKLAMGHFQSPSHPTLLCLPHEKILNITATPMTTHPSQAPTPLSKNTGKLPSSSASSSSRDEGTPSSGAGDEASAKPKVRTGNGDILSSIHQSGACYQTPFNARSDAEASA